MRRKDVIVPFKEIFGDYLAEKGYIWIKDCFVKYNNSLLNRIGLFSRKISETVEIDIVFYFDSIDETEFSDDLSVGNEYSNCCLSQIEYSKKFDGIHFVNYWEYDVNNADEPRKTLRYCFELFKEYFDVYFNATNAEDLKAKQERYNNELYYNKSTQFPEEKLLDAFIGNATDFPDNNTYSCYKELYNDSLLKLRFQYYYLCERLIEESGSDDFEYLRESTQETKETKELLNAFFEDDFNYVTKIAQKIEAEKQSTISKNIEILKKYNLY